MIENTEQLIDIYDMWYEPFWAQGKFALAVCILFCLLALVLFYFVYKKYIKKTVAIDCSVIVYQELEWLKKKQITNKQDSKDCYFSLSSIIKQYLACRYNILFLRLTDKEIVEHAKHYMIEDNVQLLRKLLQGMTFVKFEHEVVASKRLEKDIEIAQAFIENTTLEYETKGN